MILLGQYTNCEWVVNHSQKRLPSRITNNSNCLNLANKILFIVGITCWICINRFLFHFRRQDISVGVQILDFYILYLDQFKLKRGYTVTWKCSFAEFELTFLIRNCFVQITLGWPPWPLDQSWGPRVAINNFLWVGMTHKNYSEGLGMLRKRLWTVQRSFQWLEVHKPLAFILPFCRIMTSYESGDS